MATAIAVLLSTSGCTAIARAIQQSPKVKARRAANNSNPAYRDGQQPSGTTLALPPRECMSERDARLVRATEERTWATDELLPAIWRAASVDPGGERHRVGSNDDGFCHELFVRESIPWSGSPQLAEAAAAALEGTEHTMVLVPLVVFPYACREKMVSVNDGSGAKIGEVGTGEDICSENGNTWVYLALVGRDGEIVWRNGTDASTHQHDTARMSDWLVEGLPPLRS